MCVCSLCMITQQTQSLSNQSRISRAPQYAQRLKNIRVLKIEGIQTKVKFIRQPRFQGHQSQSIHIKRRQTLEMFWTRHASSKCIQEGYSTLQKSFHCRPLYYRRVGRYMLLLINMLLYFMIWLRLPPRLMVPDGACWMHLASIVWPART